MSITSLLKDTHLSLSASYWGGERVRKRGHTQPARLLFDLLFDETKVAFCCVIITIFGRSKDEKYSVWQRKIG